MSGGFTPGPWLRMRQTVYALDKSGTTNRFSVHPNGGWLDSGQKYTPDEELAANMCLIEAAPDLLEAVESFDFKERDIVSATADSLILRVPLATIHKMTAALHKVRGGVV